MITHKGITVQRSGNDVQNRINRAAVKQRCPYYYELADTLNDRPTTTPLAIMSSINAPDEGHFEHVSENLFENHFEVDEEEESALDTETAAARTLPQICLRLTRKLLRKLLAAKGLITTY